MASLKFQFCTKFGKNWAKVYIIYFQWTNAMVFQIYKEKFSSQKDDYQLWHFDHASISIGCVLLVWQNAISIKWRFLTYSECQSNVFLVFDILNIYKKNALIEMHLHEKQSQRKIAISILWKQTESAKMFSFLKENFFLEP